MTWNNNISELVTVNGRYSGTSTSVVYMPLSGTTNESTTSNDDEAIVLVSGSNNKALSLNFMTDTIMGSTVFTLVDNGSLVGTKTVNISTADIIYRIDFTNNLDSGTNVFTDRLAIGVNPTNAGNTQLFSLLIERGLF